MMPRKGVPGCLLVTSLLLIDLLGSLAYADSLRCGRKLVRDGDSQDRLLSACGQPVQRDSATEQVWWQGSRQALKVQRWYYKPSNRGLTRIVWLHRGTVVSIKSGRR